LFHVDLIFTVKLVVSFQNPKIPAKTNNGVNLYVDAHNNRLLKERLDEYFKRAGVVFEGPTMSPEGSLSSAVFQIG